MRRKLVQLLAGKKVLIQTHDFPDPDALASAFGLQQYLKYYGVRAEISYVGRPERNTSRRMLENFDITAAPVQKDDTFEPETCVVLVDAQNRNSNVTDLGGIKAVCIDHHPVFEEYEYYYQDIRNTGACASILASYFKEDGLPIEPNVAAALAYAIKMDTADFTRGTTLTDTEIFSWLFERADWKLVQSMYANTLELADLRAYEAAIQSIKIDEKVGFAYIPFICQPALIAIISDFMKALDEVNIAVVYAMQEEGIRFSVRSEEENVDVGILIKQVLNGIGDGGGHPQMAGGYIYKESAERLGVELHQTIRERFMRGIQELRSGKESETCTDE